MTDVSTFGIENRKPKFVSGPSIHCTTCFEKLYEHNGIKVVKKQIYPQSWLENWKNKTEKFEKSGIWEINSNDFSEKCYGRSQRDLKIRYGEQSAHIKNGKTEKSSVTYHVLNFGYSVGKS